MAAPPAALHRLEPLLDAYRRLRPVRVVQLPGPSWRDALENAAGVLLVGSPRRSPRTSITGVFAASPTGRRVPVGWLPDAGERLAVYASAARRVVLRQAEGLASGPIVVLGERGARAQAAAGAAMAPFAGASVPAFQWTGERLMRNDLLPALQCGPGAALYFGHGFSHGWFGYGGIRAADLRPGREPIGAVLSLTCAAASRGRAPFSFCEELALSGVCAAALGAAGRTLHRNNVEIGARLCSLAARGNAVLGDLLLGLPAALLPLYRIVGDPLTPLAGAPEAATHARAVFAPAPGDPIPPPLVLRRAGSKK